MGAGIVGDLKGSGEGGKPVGSSFKMGCEVDGNSAARGVGGKLVGSPFTVGSTVVEGNDGKLAGDVKG